MEQMKTVACIDTSGSTEGCIAYYDRVNDLIKDAYKIITWNSEAAEVNQKVLDKDIAHGATLPHTFIKIIRKYEFKYHLIVTTDGQMYDDDIQRCKYLLSRSNIFDNIIDFKIYYIGKESEMNMKIDNLFTSPKFKKEIFINDAVNCSVDINIDFERISFDDITKNNDFKASLISLLARYPDQKRDIRSKICKASNRILSELADKNDSIKKYFESNDVAGCVSFIKNGSSIACKMKLQQKISEVLKLFKKGTNLYTLSHLSNTATLQPVDIPTDTRLEQEAEDEVSGDIFCDIMYTKCKHLCIPIKNTIESIIPDSISKKISIHPFLLLKHEDIVKKILDLVEYQQMDLRSYCQLNNKALSPFTRHPLKGVYVFNGDNNDIDLEIIRKNNNRVLSVIFGANDKLPGNKGIWNTLFLYLLMKYHPKWKTEPEIIKREIQYVSANTRSFLTLSPLLDPNIKDPLNVCLWYVVNVSHKVSPNSSKNILREMGESSEYFLDFYSDVFNTIDEDLRTKNKSWLVWNYMVQQKSNRRKLKSEMLGQYQNYIEINGAPIFFSGKCEKRYKSFLNILPVERVVGLNKILRENSGKYDKIDHVVDEMPNVTFVKNLESESMEHVTVCLETCQPTIICPVTGKHWRECVGAYNVENASYFRAFKDYCFKEKKYPKTEYDLMAYLNNKHYNKYSEFLIYPSNTLEELKLVMKKFIKVVEIHSAEDYLLISTMNNSEVDRRENEKTCSYQSCKHSLQ